MYVKHDKHDKYGNYSDYRTSSWWGRHASPYRLSVRLTSAAHTALMRECRHLHGTPTDLVNDLLENTERPQAVALPRRRLW